jgi:hypothetical protein
MGISHQANIHEVDGFVNLDDIVAYTSINHDVTQPDDNGIKDDMPKENALLAYMAGRCSGTSPGNIWQVLAANHAPNKNRSRKANKGNSAPSTFQLGDMSYYLNKDETNNFQGQNYSAHMASIPYHVSQHDVAVIKKALIFHGANGGICGDDMTVLEGSERFVDAFGQVIRSVSFGKLRLKRLFPHIKVMSSKLSTRWLCLVKEKVFFFACKWKLMVQITTIGLALYPVENNGSL